MIDITSVTDGDLKLIDTQVAKGANVLQIQLGNLEYAPEFGVDLDFFLDPNFQFQNETFKAYLIQRLAEHHVNVSQCLEVLDRFVLNYTFTLGEPDTSGGSFIR